MESKKTLIGDNLKGIIEDLVGLHRKNTTNKPSKDSQLTPESNDKDNSNSLD